MEAKIMIVIIEGPRCAGKSIFAGSLCAELQNQGISASTWKSSRGEDPVSDMLSSLESFVENQVWILDRFHFTEWINSYYLQRGWTLSNEWRKIKRGLMNIDDKLHEKNTIIILLTTQAHTLRERWKETNRIDIVNEPQRILKIWEGIFDLTKCDIIHFHNDTQQMLIRNVNIIVDLIKGRIK